MKNIRTQLKPSSISFKQLKENTENSRSCCNMLSTCSVVFFFNNFYISALNSSKMLQVANSRIQIHRYILYLHMTPPYTCNFSAASSFYIVLALLKSTHAPYADVTAVQRRRADDTAAESHTVCMNLCMRSPTSSCNIITFVLCKHVAGNLCVFLLYVACS